MTAWLLTWLWQGAALAGGVAFALRCVRRLNAATKHLIWCGLLVAITWLGCASSPFVALVALKGCASDALQASGGRGLQPCRELAGAEPLLYIPSAPDHLLTIFTGIWAAIALVNLLRLLPSLHAVYALRDRCRAFPPDVEAQLPLWLEAKAQGRQTELTICDDVGGATVLGFQRPCIAIPSALIDALTRHELDQVVLHEHAHVHRRDDWARLLQTLLMSILWIHPAALLVSRALDREREMACDEWVVARTGLPKAYARCLARAAEVRGRVRTGLPLVPALLGGRHNLVRRVDRLLTVKQPCRRVSLVAATVSACAIVVISVQLQGMHVFAEIGEILLPQVSRPVVVIDGAAAAVRLKPDTDNYAPYAPNAPNAPDAPNAPGAPITSAFAPEPQIGTSVEADAPSLSARAFPGAYSLLDAPIAPNAPIAPIAPNPPNAPNAPNSWRAMATPGIEVASAAKKTSVGIAGVFSRAGVSLARRF